MSTKKILLIKGLELVSLIGIVISAFLHIKWLLLIFVVLMILSVAFPYMLAGKNK
jgi:uncharacterized membrane protein